MSNVTAYTSDIFNLPINDDWSESGFPLNLLISELNSLLILEFFPSFDAFSIPLFDLLCLLLAQYVLYRLPATFLN